MPEGALDLSHIRGRVQEILGKIPAEWWKTQGARSAVPTLIEKTRHGSYKVGVAAVEALGHIGDPSARQALLQFLFGEVNAQRASSMAVAGGFAAAKEALEVIDPEWRRSEDGRQGIYGLIKKLVDADSGTRGHGSHGLPQIDPAWTKSEEAKRALPALVLGLRAPEKYQRSSAAFYLGEIGDPQAVDPLLDALDDAEDYVQQSARRALESFMPPEEIAARLQARKQGPASAAAAPAAAVAKPKQDRSQEWLKKAWEMNPDAPACFQCGKPLGGGGSLLDGGGRVFTAGVTAGSAADMQQRYRLFQGTVCFACLAVFCTDCVGKPVDRCPACGGATKPAFQRELLELRGQGGARRVQAFAQAHAGAAAPAVEETDAMVAAYEQEILRFLTTPRTKEYERQTNSWWAKDNLQLVLAKAGFMDDAGESFVPRVEAAIRSLLKKGKIRTNGAEYRAS